MFSTLSFCTGQFLLFGVYQRFRFCAGWFDARLLSHLFCHCLHWHLRPYIWRLVLLQLQKGGHILFSGEDTICEQVDHRPARRRRGSRSWWGCPSCLLCLRALPPPSSGTWSPCTTRDNVIAIHFLYENLKKKTKSCLKCLELEILCERKFYGGKGILGLFSRGSTPRGLLGVGVCGSVQGSWIAENLNEWQNCILSA